MSDAFNACKNRICPPGLLQNACLLSKIDKILSCSFCAIDEPQLKDFANAFCMVDLSENCNDSTQFVKSQNKDFEFSFFTDELDDQSVNVSWTTSELNFCILPPIRL